MSAAEVGGSGTGGSDVTRSDDGLPGSGAAEPGAPHDPEVAEEYAESVGVDPTPEQIDHYLELEGDRPLGEPQEDDSAAVSERADQPEPSVEDLYPERARSERAAETPPQEDAEAMESALREHGPLAADPHEQERRTRPTEPGPGTSLT